MGDTLFTFDTWEFRTFGCQYRPHVCTDVFVVFFLPEIVGPDLRFDLPLHRPVGMAGRTGGLAHRRQRSYLWPCRLSLFKRRLKLQCQTPDHIAGGSLFLWRPVLGHLSDQARNILGVASVGRLIRIGPGSFVPQICSFKTRRAGGGR